METADKLQAIYAARFSSLEQHRYKVWRILISSYFDRWIPSQGHVLDLGCGYGEFINQIAAQKRYGMDMNPETAKKLDEKVIFIQQDCSATWNVPDASLDLVFTSNFFEHLPDKASLSRTLAEAFRCLKPGGTLIALGPNINVVEGRYWDFWDHYLPLTEKSLSEGMSLAGFKIREVVPRFLPYTMVGAPRYPLWLLTVYLRLPFFWRIFGEQFLVVAARPAS